MCVGPFAIVTPELSLSVPFFHFLFFCFQIHVSFQPCHSAYGIVLLFALRLSPGEVRERLEAKMGMQRLGGRGGPGGGQEAGRSRMG